MKTMFQKIWERHAVVPETADTPAVLYVDLHLVHEVTTPQAFTMLRELGLGVRRPDLTLATMDHSTPTRSAQAAWKSATTCQAVPRLTAYSAKSSAAVSR